MATNLSSSLWEINKEISIYGEWFGSEIGQYGWICFDSNDKCFVKDSPWLISWNDNQIRFYVPGNISLKWKFKVYINGKLKDELNYSVKPTILDISDGTYIKKSGWAGEKILIQWNWFGNIGGSVYLAEYRANIVSWSENEIWVNLPQTKKITNNLRVENNIWITSSSLSFDLYPKVSNDQYSARQQYLSVLWVQEIWNKYPKLWDGITVAVLDVGVKLNHVDLKDSLWVNKSEIVNNWIDDDANGYIDDSHWWNFVSNNNNMNIQSDHGTMIAGIIAARKDNWLWIAGIAPNTKVMVLKIFDDGLNMIYNIDKAVKYAVDNGAKIINMSFGADDLWFYDDGFDKTFEYAYNNWAVLIAAAGNTLNKDKQNLDKYLSSPVCNDWNKDFVIWVSATNNQKIKSDFARYGARCVDISAPGEDIFSLSDKRYNSGDIDYTYGQWTSFAAPIVAAAAAWFWSNNPDLKNADIYTALKQTGDDIDDLNQDYRWKMGKFINIKKLMERNSPSTKNDISTSNVDKKALSIFLSLRSKMRNYSVVKRQYTYQSIYDMLERFSKDPNQQKNLVFIHWLMSLIWQEIWK